MPLSPTSLTPSSGPKIDFLDKDLSYVTPDVRVFNPSSQFHRFEPELFVSTPRFIRYLQNNYGYFDVMTYTHRAIVHFSVRRLIYAIDNPDGLEAKEARLASNVHTKMVLCYTKTQKVRDVFVGSSNMMESKTLNVMVKVSKPIRIALTQYFNDVWEQLV